jgi:flagellar hook assembly protein FlgD
MKNSIKTFAYAFAIVATAAFSAKADNKDSKKSAGFGTGIYTTKSGRINVLVDKVSADAPTTLLLKNENGEVVYRETVGKNEQKFGRILNVEELAPGKYEIEVASKGEKQSKSFQLSEQTMERTLAIK